MFGLTVKQTTNKYFHYQIMIFSRDKQLYKSLCQMCVFVCVCDLHKVGAKAGHEPKNSWLTVGANWQIKGGRDSGSGL